VNRDLSVFCVFCVFLISFLALNYKCQKSRHFFISNANLIKLHKIFIQDLLNLLTKNHVDRTIGSRVIPNLGVHTFADRQVELERLNEEHCLQLREAQATIDNVKSNLRNKEEELRLTINKVKCAICLESMLGIDVWCFTKTCRHTFRAGAAGCLK